jgi:hypothetical protein
VADGRKVILRKGLLWQGLTEDESEQQHCRKYEVKHGMCPGCISTALKTHLVSSWSLALLQQARGKGHGVSNPHSITHNSLYAFSSRLSLPLLQGIILAFLGIRI